MPLMLKSKKVYDGTGSSVISDPVKAPASQEIRNVLKKDIQPQIRMHSRTL